MEIKNRHTQKTICKGKEKMRRLAQNNKANLREADLRRADLQGTDLREANLWRADLQWADLREANLRRADLRRVNLQEADLWRADLQGTDLREADLRRADLRRANLREANLRRADLREANLRRADLQGADLREAEIEFHQFPSIRMLSSINLGKISNKLALELMRWDAFCHPSPQKFTEWAEDGNCPYQNEERFWFFAEKKEVWKHGKPRMTGAELILAICKEKGWKIKGYLK